MNVYITTGRVFLGLSLLALGVLHMIFPGIRPLVCPDLSHLPAQFSWIKYLTAALLIAAGWLICAGKKQIVVALIVGIVFFLLFLFAHLPAFLAVQGRAKIPYWTNLNKALALSGGFFVLAALQAKQSRPTQFNLLVRTLWWPGSYFFAIMIFLFGLGHLLSTAALSTLVPDYIPFKKFWTLIGGIALMGSAMSIFVRWKIEKILFLLAVVLFVWLITLHLYYAFRSPGWQEGENFIGSLTCLAFCGIALLISKSRLISTAQ